MDQIADFPVSRHGDGADQDADSPSAERLLVSPVPLTMEEIADTPESSRKSRRTSWQNRKVLFDWDKEGRLSALMRLSLTRKRLCFQGGSKAMTIRGSIAGCRRETEDLDDCSVQDQKDIVEPILAELQQCVADPAYEWFAQQSS